MTHRPDGLEEQARLTAYALDELSADDRAGLARYLEDDAVARAEIESIRRVALQLEDAFRDETVPSLTAQQRDRILEASPPTESQRALRFPAHRRWIATGLAVAACVLVSVAAILAPIASRPAGPERVAIAPQNESGAAVSPPASARADTALRQEIADEINDMVAMTPAAQAKLRSTELPLKAGGEPIEVLKSTAVVGSSTGSGLDAVVGQGDVEGMERDALRAVAPVLPVAPVPQEELAADTGRMAFVSAQAQTVLTLPIEHEIAELDRWLTSLAKGDLPPRGAVSVSSLVNRFVLPPAAQFGRDPLALSAELGPVPWNRDNQLLFVTLQSAPREKSSGGIAGAETVARVKFNPRRVASYRLIDGEARGDGGEPTARDGVRGQFIAGAAMAWLCEIAPRRGGGDRDDLEPLARLGVEYQRLGGDAIARIDDAVQDSEMRLEQMSPAYRFVASVAWLGLLLRDQPPGFDSALEGVRELAEGSLVDEPADSPRRDVLQLIEQAREAGRRRDRDAAEPPDR